jgi:3-isopropylmalate/(R)-2-methylmalate dehydratase small subunit
LDFGFRCIIAPSFADIFYNNCFKNGILPIRLEQNNVDNLMVEAENKKLLSINLEDQTITNESNKSISFDIEPFRKKCLLEGLDDISLTLKKDAKIKSFETSMHQSFPWIV